ncbi:UNVERIFIED_ORG: catechol 2,3-dioxygenase-like lactoylglutathione lyase family enzyme [Variovorax paradoxus]|jgi:catechol 2,3-dioxygenase-like lactoylglutathione lyase family enzyme|nr:catechol 2,3-dioxygenase-like lactoylglutathione lyase family enzyme [Variovorax paradoxus]
MNIIGPDELVFGVADVDAAERFLADYGLLPRTHGRFEALDGTAVVIKAADDPSLPRKTLDTANMLRKTVYGVADEDTLRTIAEELRRDREVKQLPDGSLECIDDVGFLLGFKVSRRRPVDLQAERVNAPGDLNRPINTPASPSSGEGEPPRPRTLSHVVYFVPDVERAEAFYRQRLGFRVSDRFIGMGPFLRPAGTIEHHTLFLIKTPPHMQGCEHFTFHMGGPGELLTAGWNLANKGYQSHWGPGRHRFGSNWFWYFNSPLGCHVEYDADMDLHDDQWVPREVPAETDMSQVFLFDWREKWAPGGPPPKAE